MRVYNFIPTDIKPLVVNRTQKIKMKNKTEPIVYREPENKIGKTKEVKQPALVNAKKVVSTFNL